jgi:hypothetical protein
MNLNFLYLLKLKWAITISIFASIAQASDSNLYVPLTEKAWTLLAFNNIPKNSVDFIDQQIKVKVKGSAGPLIFKLPKLTKITEFSIKGKITGSKKVELEKFDEDSVLRFGLVAAGTKFLSGPKKWLAADWVKKLFELAPSGVGLDKIYFYNFTNRNELINQKRVHPKSDLIEESISFLQTQEGSFSIRKKLDSPINTAALWLSIDGDDTISEYETQLSEILIQSEAPVGK